MRVPKVGRTLLPFLCLAALVSVPTAAQTDPPPAQPTRAAAPSQGNLDRLFLSFAEDATLVDSQWWEGQLEIAELELTDLWVARGIVAFNPIADLEFGGRVGFGSTDSSRGLPDGSGATDLDVWGKYHIQRNSVSQVAFGAVVTVPTGDDTAGLGFDSFAVQVFASLRQALVKDMTLAVNGGVRLNEDGSFLGASLDGENSLFVSGGLLIPIRSDLMFVGEARYESERFDELDSDSRVLGGLNWQVTDRGIVRGALAVGFTDGAPDWQLIGGYAYAF